MLQVTTKISKNEDKDCMEAWNLISKTVKHVGSWKELFNGVVITGKCYWFIT